MTKRSQRTRILSSMSKRIPKGAANICPAPKIEKTLAGRAPRRCTEAPLGRRRGARRHRLPNCACAKQISRQHPCIEVPGCFGMPNVVLVAELCRDCEPRVAALIRIPGTFAMFSCFMPRLTGRTRTNAREFAQQVPKEKNYTFGLADANFQTKGG